MCAASSSFFLRASLVKVFRSASTRGARVPEIKSALFNSRLLLLAVCASIVKEGLVLLENYISTRCRLLHRGFIMGTRRDKFVRSEGHLDFRCSDETSDCVYLFGYGVFVE